MPTNKKKKQFTNNLSQRQKAVIILAIVTFSLILVYSISTIIYRAGKAKITIRIAPNDAKIILNDTTVSNNSTIWLEKGKYHLEASFNEHLSTYIRDLDIQSDQEIYGVLNAQDDEGKAYIEQHSQEYTTVEGLIGILQNKEGEKIRKQYPILNHLPINNSLYSISYDKKDDSAPLINVKTKPEFIDTVVAKLKTFKDVDISSLNIVFHNKNDFANYQQNPITDAKKFIRAAYQLSDKYKINDIQQINDYYYTTVYISDYKNSLNYSHYRILLKKNKDNEWQEVSTPQPILTTYNTPKVDKEILNTINSY